jgi:hypothetical protein
MLDRAVVVVQRIFFINVRPPPDPIVLKLKKFGLDAPAEYNCKISYNIIAQPVVLIGSGNTYDSTSIETWSALGNKTDPLTNVIMQSMATTPNHLVNSQIIEHCTIEMNKFEPAAVKIQAVIRDKWCRAWYSFCPCLEYYDASAEVPVDAPAARVVVPYFPIEMRGDETLDNWVRTTYGEEYDWGFISSMIDLESAHELLPTFRVLDDSGDAEVGIAIVEREFESEEEFEDEKARIKDEENLLDFAHVYNGDGDEIEIAGQRGCAASTT